MVCVEVGRFVSVVSANPLEDIVAFWVKNSSVNCRKSNKTRH